MRFVCTIDNLKTYNFKIYIDDVIVNNYELLSDKLSFELNLDKGKHLIRIVFSKICKNNIDKNTLLTRLNTNFVKFNKTDLFLSYGLEYKINRDSELKLSLCHKNCQSGKNDIDFYCVKKEKFKGLTPLNEFHDFNKLKKEGGKLIVLNNIIGLMVSITMSILCLCAVISGSSSDHILLCAFFFSVFLMFLIKMLLTIYEWQSTYNGIAGRTGDS